MIKHTGYFNLDITGEDGAVADVYLECPFGLNGRPLLILLWDKNKLLVWPYWKEELTEIASKHPTVTINLIFTPKDNTEQIKLKIGDNNEL